jgi:cell wall assembly regulator SMI1
MPDYEWKSDYTTVEPGATEREIASVEARLGVRFPETLRHGFKVARNASLFKQGQYCGGAVTGPVAGGGRYVGSLSYLEPIDRIEAEKTDMAEYVADLYQRPFPDVIPFAQLGAGGWTCLNYQNDPTRANPEVWEGDMETNATFEDFFHKVADSFDDFIEMLLPDDEIEALGFRV